MGALVEFDFRERPHGQQAVRIGNQENRFSRPRIRTGNGVDSHEVSRNHKGPPCFLEGGEANLDPGVRAESGNSFGRDLNFNLEAPAVDEKADGGTRGQPISHFGGWPGDFPLERGADLMPGHHLARLFQEDGGLGLGGSSDSKRMFCPLPEGPRSQEGCAGLVQKGFGGVSGLNQLLQPFHFTLAQNFLLQGSFEGGFLPVRIGFSRIQSGGGRVHRQSGKGVVQVKQDLPAYDFSPHFKGRRPPGNLAGDFGGQGRDARR